MPPASPPVTPSDEEIFSVIAEEFAPAYSLPEFAHRASWIRRVARKIGRSQDAEYLIDRQFSITPLSSADIRELWQKALEEESRGDRPRNDLHFYLHIPFCRQRCSFCYYYLAPVEDGSGLKAYLNALIDSLDFHRPTFAKRNFQTLYVGGGTPTILSPEQIDRFLGAVFERFSFDPNGEKSFECMPASVTPEKIAILTRYGINRISMGIQSLDQEILDGENRGYQKSTMVLDAVRMIEDGGPFKLNVDLLLGMQGDSEDNFIKTFTALVSRKKANITVYPITPTVHYLDRHYEGSAQKYHADLERRYGRAAERTAELARKFGYGCRDNMLLQDHSWVFTKPFEAGNFSTNYDDVSEAPILLFGLGPASESRIAGAKHYVQRRITDERFDPKAPIFSVMDSTWRDEMVKYVAMSLWKREDMSLARFKKLFGRDFRNTFPRAVGDLERQGSLSIDGDAVHFSNGEGRSRFLAALRFLGAEPLDEIFFEEISLVSGEHKVVLRTEPLRKGQEYIVSWNQLGLRAVGTLYKIFGEKEYYKGLEFLRELFVEVTDNAAAKGIRAIATSFRSALETGLTEAQKEGRFIGISVLKS